MTKLYYHCTDKVFDRFDPAMQGTKAATNGYLGVWVGNERDACDMFGDVLMTLSVPEVVSYPMAYRELRGLHDHTQFMDDEDAAKFYRAFARGLMAEGYTVIDIMEKHFLPSHSIILDLDSIVIESCEILEREKPSTWGVP